MATLHIDKIIAEKVNQDDLIRLLETVIDDEMQRPEAEMNCDLIDALRLEGAFQSGPAAGATVMPLLMQGYDTAQMQALAQWFARPQDTRP